MERSQIPRINDLPERTPGNGTFELTVRCNLHCKMCLFRHDDRENPEIVKRELTARQWVHIARQVAEAGTINLLVTGGEPMIRSDFCEIWEGIYQQGFLITLYTNATMLTPKIMETLRKYPPHKIGVTIYGASPETYGKVCGNSEAFEKAVFGIKQLQDLPSVIEYRATIIKDNCEDAEAIRMLVQKRLQRNAVVTYSDTITKAVRGGCADVENCRLDPETEQEMHLQYKLNLIREFVGDEFNERRIGIKKTGNKRVDEKRNSLLGCSAGMSSYTVAWDGKLLACQMLGVFHTDLLERDFLQAWKELPEKILLPSENRQCTDCKVAEYCQSCYATRYAETGNLRGCCDYIYQNASAISKITNYYTRRK